MKARRSRRCRSLTTAPPLALAVLLGSLSCAEPPAPPAAVENAPEPAAPVAGGTAIIAVAADITSVNPLVDSADAFNSSILDMLYLHLFEEQPDFTEGPPSFEPELAAAWEWSEDGRALTVELRPGVVWDDGVPVTADDVVWTWRLQTDERLAWEYAGLKSSIGSIEALDAGRLRVRFTNDSTSRLADLNQGQIVPRHRWRELPIESWRDSGGWFRDNLVVNGPFRLAEWRPDQQIVLERNPRYWRPGRPRLDRVVFRIVPDPNSRLNQLLDGAADFVPHLPAAAVPRVEADPDLRLATTSSHQFTYIHWNLERPPLDETAARQALILAIDRQRIVDTLWFGHAVVASSPIVSTVWAHRDDPGAWPHDPDRARRLLAEAGWRDADGDGVLERDGRRFAFELLISPANRARADAAVMVQEDLRRIGVEARVRQLEWNTIRAKLDQRDFDAVLLGLTMDTSLDLTYAFHSGSIGGRLNFGGYSNPRADRLIEQARASQDLEERGRLLWEIQGILHDEQPFAFLWEPDRLHGVSRRLRDVRPNLLDPYHHIDEWWLAPEPR